MRFGYVPFILLGVDAAARIQAAIANGGVYQVVSLLEAPDGVAGYVSSELPDVPDEVSLTLKEFVSDQIFIGTANEFNAKMLKLHEVGYDVYFEDISVGSEDRVTVVYSVEFDLCTCDELPDDDELGQCPYCVARAEIEDAAPARPDDCSHRFILRA